MPKMRNSSFVKVIFSKSKAIIDWWNPESRDPLENPLLVFQRMYIKERTDILGEIENRVRSRLSTILDVGCGDGRLCLDLIRKKDFNIIALDLSGIMLDRAKTKYCQEKSSTARQLKCFGAENEQTSNGSMSRDSFPESSPRLKPV